MRCILSALSLLCLTGIIAPSAPIFAQEAPVSKPSAKTGVPPPNEILLQTAFKKAKPQDKKASEKRVFVIFHASWCGWCKRLEAMLEEKDVRKVMETHYNFVRLDVMEEGGAKALENPGGSKFLEELGGAKAGLPFYAVLDAKGKKLTDSLQMLKEENIGYPGTPEEIAAFVKILKATAPKMTDAEREIVIASLKKNAPKPTPILPQSGGRPQ